ncbi:hypothetical protein, partial [Acetobacter indonesiensis]|uniref:hypothetical protein n=1 Tax=Acetobacter indonesiensis TaxID=104101 RepID=UPI0039EAB28F
MAATPLNNQILKNMKTYRMDVEYIYLVGFFGLRILYFLTQSAIFQVCPQYIVVDKILSSKKIYK